MILPIKKKKTNQQQYSTNTGGLILGVAATDVFKASLTWQSCIPDKTGKVGHGQEPRALWTVPNGLHTHTFCNKLEICSVYCVFILRVH